MTILQHSICTSLLITGIYVACQWPGMLLYTPARWAERRLPDWMVRPLCQCMICMSSVWTIIYSLVMHTIGIRTLIQIPMVAGICVFLSYIVTHIRYGSIYDNNS